MPAATSLHTFTGMLEPRPPFDFVKTLGFLQGFSPTVGEQRLTDGTITKAVTLHGRAIAFTLHSTGTIQNPALAYTLFSASPSSDAERAAVADRIAYFLSLDDDLEPFYALGRADPSFAPVIERLYGLHQPKFLTPFEIACWAVLVQRTPMPIAHRTKLALVERYGTSITLPEGTFHAFSEPEQLMAADFAELGGIIRNERKADYLRSVVEYFARTDEQWLRTGEYADVAAQLRSVRGIGEWSAHFILVRGLGRMERVSSVDRELARAAAQIYRDGQQLTAAEMQQILDYYGLSQGYWAYYSRVASLGKMVME